MKTREELFKKWEAIAFETRELKTVVQNDLDSAIASGDISKKQIEAIAGLFNDSVEHVLQEISNTRDDTIRFLQRKLL